MAKTLMISNEIYGELKKIKNNKSFSETIKELIEAKKIKIGTDLIKHTGILKNDKEYDKIIKELKPSYKKWTKRYA